MALIVSTAALAQLSLIVLHVNAIGVGEVHSLKVRPRSSFPFAVVFFFLTLPATRPSGFPLISLPLSSSFAMDAIKRTVDSQCT